MSKNIAALKKELREVKLELARVKEALQNATAKPKRANANGEDHASLTELRQELRTPLNTVLGFAQLLKSSAVGDSEPVEQIFTAATHLAQLIAEEPNEKKRPGAKRADSVASQPPDMSGKVLYVEDNTFNCRLVGRILERRHGVEVLFAKTGGEGLAVAREWLPDVVLLDLNLPDMNGAELLQALRSDKGTEHIPVVVVSADATATQIERLLSAGARNYLTKPIDVAQFLFTVDEILGERQLVKSKV
jgi:CheY-like chemotaxis protein